MTNYVTWLRDHVGQRKVFLPFVTVILRDEHNRILLQRRTDFAFWGMPGGVIEMHEDILTAAHRELSEETGLQAGELRLVGVYTDPKYDLVYPNGDQAQQFTVCLEGRRTGGRMRPDGVETTEQRFVEPRDLDRYDLPIWYRDMLLESSLKTSPQFRPPRTAGETADQAASIRPFVGNDRFAGIGAAVVLRRKDGRLLLLRHVGESHWRVPSGFANLGENIAQTAVREIKEELALDITLERLIGVHATPELNVTYANGDRIRNVGVVFTARINRPGITLDKTEIDAVAWVTPHEAVERVHAGSRKHYQQIIRHLDRGYFID